MESGARQNQFQSTHSLRSATHFPVGSIYRRVVSIHALLAECDTSATATQRSSLGFNPRTPCGVRPYFSLMALFSAWFQSTHSLRSATQQVHDHLRKFHVSIHALLAECDLRHPALLRSIPCFNPRTPCGVRPNMAVVLLDREGFNPRTPCGVRLRLTIYIVIQQRKRYFAPTSRRRPSSPSLLL